VHNPAQADEWIALWTLYSAIAAAIIAFGTLVAVGFQIWLGRQELNAVRDDLALSRKQIAYIERRAQLKLRVSDGDVANMQWISDSTEAEGTLRLWLHNDGKNTARSATIILLMPDCWKPPGWDGIHDAGPAFAQQGLKLISNRPTEHDGRCWWITAEVTSPIYPGIPTLAKEFKIIIPQGFDGDLLWRIGYDDGIEPPPDKPSGRLHYSVVSPRPIPR
jgi:hypothetical protein